MNILRLCFGARESIPPRLLGASLRGSASLLCVLLLTAVFQARGQEADDAYLKIFNLVQEADTLAEKGARAPALSKYQEAGKALQAFRTEYPGWNIPLVTFRQKYVAERITALTAPAPETVAPAPKPAATPPGSKPSAIQVKLLEAGAEPRSVLRLHPAAGDKQTLTMSSKVRMEMGLGGAPAQTVQMPEMKVVVDLEVKAVAPDGDVTYEVKVADAAVVGDVGANPQAAALKTVLEGIKGLTGKTTVSARGIPKTSEMQAPANIAPEARQGVEQIKDFLSRIATPFPEEAVGAGARWSVTMPAKFQGFTVDQTVTYILVSLDGDAVRAKSTIAQKAARQKIENPVMPNVKMDLVKMDSQGVGDTTLDIRRIFPIQGKMILKSAVDMSMAAGGQTQQVTIKTDSDVALSSK